MNRDELKILFRESSADKIRPKIKAFLTENRSFRDYQFLSKQIDLITADMGKKCRIVVLSSFTFDQVKEFLSVELTARGYDTEIKLAGFNQYNQEILNLSSQTYGFNPTVVILAVRIEELFPEFQWSYNEYTAKQLKVSRQCIVNDVNNLLLTLRSGTDATILVNNFTHPVDLVCGTYDCQNLGRKRDPDLGDPSQKKPLNFL